MIPQPFNPLAWHWIVGGDESRAWSSAARAYVDTWPADAVTRIADEARLDRVLRSYGLPSPIITADDVRAEASRRMQAAFGARDTQHLEMIIANASREEIRLQEKRLANLADGGPDLTADELARVAELKAADALIEAIRAASNSLESDPPSDYTSDQHWP